MNARRIASISSSSAACTTCAFASSAASRLAAALRAHAAPISSRSAGFTPVPTSTHVVSVRFCRSAARSARPAASLRSKFTLR